MQKKKSFILKIMKAMINKYQLLMPLFLKVMPAKEEHIKYARDGKIIAPSVARDNEGKSEFQRVSFRA